MQQQPNPANNPRIPAVSEEAEDGSVQANDHAQQLIAEATASAAAYVAWAHAHRAPRLRTYLTFRAIPLDAEEIIRHFEQVGDDAVLDHCDLFAIEDNFAALLDRFEERLRGEFLPTRHGLRQAQELVAQALREALACIEQGRIQGEGASPGRDESSGLLQILAGHEDLVDLVSWTSLREDEDEAAPLLIERWLWHVEPGETSETCPALAILREWILRALP